MKSIGPCCFGIFLLLFLSHPAFAQVYVPGQTYFGTNNYIEYHAGNLPIIISAPHGGYVEPTTIPDRNCSGCVTVRDSRTEETILEMDTAIRQYLGGYPHIIINKLARIKLDANREIVEAAQGNPAAEQAWHEYHAFIQAAKDSLVSQYGSALYVDLHGHGHTIQRIELGYLISKTNLQMTDAALDAGNFQNQSSFRHLVNVLNPGIGFSTVLRGPQSMGALYAPFAIPCVPSLADPAPAPSDPYFSGGYNTVRHGSRDSSAINGVQFELNWTGVRNTRTNRKAFAAASACVFRDFIDTWMFPWDTLSPGQVVTTTADMGPGSLRAILGAAENGDTIRFAPALQGDSIRLTSSIVPCADVVILGPGADLLALSGMDQTRLLEINEGRQVEVRGLRFSGGRCPAGEDGGAIRNAGALRLAHCEISRNYADDDGGALANVDTATAWLDTCQVSHNSCGDDGGALRNPNGTLYLEACSVTDNSSPSNGGGLSNGGTCDIHRSTFARNHADSNGGGIRHFAGSPLQIRTSTFYGNSAGNRGGAVSMNASGHFQNSTFKENSAVVSGGGIRVVSDTCTLVSSVVTENTSGTAPDISRSTGTLFSGGHNLVSDTTGSDWQNFSADLLGNTALPYPSLTDTLADNGGPTWTVALFPASAAVDAGNAANAGPTDQRGLPRIVNADADIGAFELGPTIARDEGVPEEQVLVIPNPFSEEAMLRIPAGMTGPFQVQVFDLQGRVVWRRDAVQERQLRLAPRLQMGGLYFIKVKGMNRVATVPVLIR